jgi:hypothetical protein
MACWCRAGEPLVNNRGGSFRWREATATMKATPYRHLGGRLIPEQDTTLLHPSPRLLGRSFRMSALVVAAGLAVVTPAFATTGQTINTVAGNGSAGSTGDGGAAVMAELNAPSGVAVDLVGDLYIADTENNRVRKVVNPTQINVDTISTAAGTGVSGFGGDGGPATRAELNRPSGIAVDGQGDIFIADTGNNRVREVVASTGVIKTVAGDGACRKHGKLGDGGAATAASLCAPLGVAVDGKGDVYVSDSGHSEVRVVKPSGIIDDFAGKGLFGYSGDGRPATKARLGTPSGLALDAVGDVYIADSADTVVRKVDTSGIITTFAGNGRFGYSGDGGPATQAELADPTGLGVDQAGDVYIADTFNNRLREVSAGGTVSTVAGAGTYGFSGDGGPATSAELARPTGAVAVDATAVYFSDTGNERVRGVFNGPPPVLPESPLVVGLPVGAVVLIAGVVLYRRRRNGVSA